MLDDAKVAVIKACPRRSTGLMLRWGAGFWHDCHHQFYSLAELNAAIAELPRRLNEEKPLRRLGYTCRQLLEELDRPALKPLGCSLMACISCGKPAGTTPVRAP